VLSTAQQYFLLPHHQPFGFILSFTVPLFTLYITSSNRHQMLAFVAAAAWLATASAQSPGSFAPGGNTTVSAMMVSFLNLEFKIRFVDSVSVDVRW
jgi:hypothetical protein